MYHPELIRHPDSCPALVLNADYTPLSYYPLSLWPWQTAVKAMFLERVDVVAHYDREVHSPSRALKLPSVIALRQFVRPNQYPAFTRFNLFLRDRFRCVYCGSNRELTFDHVVPRAQGGRTTWENVATACAPCNLKKGGRRFPADAGDIGDAILARKDAPASYHLACVADDAASGVTLVVRGADLRPSTPIQRLLQVLLGLPEPVYLHHPLVTHADGRRLAKRDLAPTLAAMREGGVDGRELVADLLANQLPLGFAFSPA